MARNLYILAGTLFFFAVVSWVMVASTMHDQPGLPGNGSLWRTIGMFLCLFSIIATVAGVATQMYEQVDRRAREREEAAAKRRRPRP
jgi:uncharacterized membrane protein YidH (DUF202 family)